MSTEWVNFEVGLTVRAGKIRTGDFDSERLHRWVEERHGCSAVSKQWLDYLLNPRQFLNRNV
ncbi:MAG: hypothetical protein ACLQSR_00410 [Limisphaerales bacterium]